MDNVVNKKNVRGPRQKRYLGLGNHQLLALKEILDAILLEGQGLPQGVRQSLEAARAATWSAFMADQEKTLGHRKACS
jgi:hypothetical protein